MPSLKSNLPIDGIINFVQNYLMLGNGDSAALAKELQSLTVPEFITPMRLAKRTRFLPQYGL